MRGLYLSQNQLVGEIPAGIGSLANLRGLYLSQNQLVGEIPAGMGDLAHLRGLRLSGNMLDGCLPQELPNALGSAELAELAMPLCEPTSADRDALAALYNATDGANWTRGDNWLSDYPIDKWRGAEVNEQGRLAILRLNENGLSGEIPPEIGELTHLWELDLSDNMLSGEIPQEMGGLAHLERLKLSGNRLDGCLPENLMDALGREELARLALPLCESFSPSEDRDALAALYNATNGSNWTSGDNWLSGYPIGKWRGVYTTELYEGRVLVFHISLSGNGLSGEIPPEIGEFALLIELNLSQNRLSGEIPPELGDLPYLETLDLSQNRLSGGIPPELGSLSFLSELRLSGNQLTGCIPDALRSVDKNDFEETGLPFCQP